ncbi:hypothetical protein AS026_03150 [Rhizobium altiplani]|uniref:Uncharacterized protein n=1 Tax=Rhizobium altiplani TaxID=1864509 RepID=A0A120FME0_9HYPH|nr:hypothetical protein AS026_03150 [Rhizobium altiplani]
MNASGGQFPLDARKSILRSLRPEPCERAYSDAGRPASERHLPARDVLKLDLLASDIHRATKRHDDQPLTTLNRFD